MVVCIQSGQDKQLKNRFVYAQIWFYNTMFVCYYQYLKTRGLLGKKKSFVYTIIVTQKNSNTLMMGGRGIRNKM